MPAAPRALALPLVAALVVALGTSPGNAAELFVADQATNRILALDEETGNFVRVVASTGLDLPSSLSWGPGGLLYATNFGAYAGPGSAASLVSINPVSGVVTPLVTTVAGPGAVAYDPVNHANSLFVSKLADFVVVEGQPMAAFTGKEVYEFDSTGALLNTIAAGTAATGRSGMAFDAEGDLYVSEFGFFTVGSVLEFDAQSNYAPLGTYASGAGVPITGPPGAFFPPTASGFNGIAFSGSDLYVAALTGTALVKFTNSGMAVTGAQADGPIAYPSGVLVEGDGNVLVTSLGNNNASDPFYPGQIFPGGVFRYHEDSNFVTPLLVGDANRDLTVDDDDLAVITSSFGINAKGDLDGDGDTDGNDFVLWQRNLGHSIPKSGTGSFLPTGIVRYTPPGVAAVPEPGTMLLALATSAVGLVRRRR